MTDAEPPKDRAPRRPLFTASAWTPNQVGARLFGRRAFRGIVKPYYGQVLAVTTLLGAAADLLGKQSQILGFLLGASIVALVVFGLLMLFRGGDRWRTGTKISGLAAVVFGVIVGAQHALGGTVTEQLPLGERIQLEIARVSGGVDRLNATAERSEVHLADASDSLDSIETIQTKTMSPALHQRLENALRLGDGQELQALSSDVYGSRNASRLLQQGPVAFDFFEAAKADPGAMAWFRETLKAGLDPNLMTRMQGDTSETVLYTAYRAGNGEAMIELLRAGANPHAYHQLSFNTDERPFFVSPLSKVMTDERLEEAQKREILKLMLKNGVVLPAKIEGRSDSQWTDAVAEDLRAFDVGQPRRAVSVCQKPAQGLCGQKAWRDKPVCDFRRAMPSMVSIADFRQQEDLVLGGLLGVYDGRAYYLGVSAGSDVFTAVLYTSADRRNWTIVQHTGDWGRGDVNCADRNETGYRYCWMPRKARYDPQARTAIRYNRPVKTGFC